MICRVRARLRSVHALDSKLQDEKKSQTVCLLSVVLLLPYLSRGHGSLLFFYSMLAVPAIISANYRYPVSNLKPLLASAQDVLRPFLVLLRRVYAPLEKSERGFTSMSNIATMINQVVFLATCDRLLLPGQRVTCLYSLMFYNVAAYCVGYVKELVYKQDWSPYVPLTEHSNVKHLAMSATKMVLEWTKAVTFVATLVLMLLALGLEQGLHYYRPTFVYASLTWLYYMCTEKVFVESFPYLVELLQLESLESMEHLWTAVGLRIVTIVLSAVCALPLALRGQFKFCLLALYFNVHIRWRELSNGALKKLHAEQAILAPYRRATAEELAEWDDVCAVCLCRMRRPRITPCHHIFHANCLRQCLKASNLCPICKRELKFD